MNRLLVKCIGKRQVQTQFPDDDQPRAIDREDYFFAVGIIFDNIQHYEEFNPNPHFPYYRNNQPKTKVIMHSGEELMAILPIKIFDEAYVKYYTERTITIKPN